MINHNRYRYPVGGTSASTPETKDPEQVDSRLLACRLDAQLMLRGALDVSGPADVARRIKRSPDLVEGWPVGRSLPNLAQLLATPRSFQVRLVSDWQGRLDAQPLLVVELRERVVMALNCLGYLLVASKTPLHEQSLTQLLETERMAEEAEKEMHEVRRQCRVEIERRRSEQKGEVL